MQKDIDINSLDAIRIDILKEIGNIGAGNATTALSKMLSKRIEMGVPKVKILEFKHVADTLGGAEVPVAGVLLTVTGEITGMMMFIIEQTSALKLVNLLIGRDVSYNETFDEIGISALKEVGNILTGSYLTALASLTKLTIIQSIPILALDMAGAILSVPAIEFGKIGDKALFIETNFEEGENSVSGYYILIPEVQSFNKIIKSLGVM